MTDSNKHISIDDYFELYLKNRIKYDRQYHIKNMNIYNFTKIDKKAFNRSSHTLIGLFLVGK